MSVAEIKETRTGRFVPHAEGYSVFIPWGLPPDPPIEPDPELWYALSEADKALGRLDGSTVTISNPDLFVSMYLRLEALNSSHIEGTEATLVDLLEFEAGMDKKSRSWELKHITGCLAAMKHGLRVLEDSSTTLKFIQACQAQIFSTGFRGRGKHPGQFRENQNYVGSPGSTVQTARYVPPPPDRLKDLLANLEEFLLKDDCMPPLIKVGLVHAQFETIHPFEDANGPIGRVLIPLTLMASGVLQRPVLCLSCYFKRHRKEYYDRLQAIRERGDWENWLKFFLRGVSHVSQELGATAIQIVRLRESHWRTIAVEMGGRAGHALTLLENLFQNPIISVQQVVAHTKMSTPEAQKLISGLQKLGFLREITGRAREQRFAYTPYLALFERQPAAQPEAETASEQEQSDLTAAAKTT